MIASKSYVKDSWLTLFNNPFRYREHDIHGTRQLARSFLIFSYEVLRTPRIERVSGAGMWYSRKAWWPKNNDKKNNIAGEHGNIWRTNFVQNSHDRAMACPHTRLKYNSFSQARTVYHAIMFIF